MDNYYIACLQVNGIYYWIHTFDPIILRRDDISSAKKYATLSSIKFDINTYKSTLHDRYSSLTSNIKVYEVRNNNIHHPNLVTDIIM